MIGLRFLPGRGITLCIGWKRKSLVCMTQVLPSDVGFLCSTRGDMDYVRDLLEEHGIRIEQKFLPRDSSEIPGDLERSLTSPLDEISGWRGFVWIEEKNLHLAMDILNEREDLYILSKLDRQKYILR